MPKFKMKWNGDALVRKVHESAFDALQGCGLDLKASSQAICPKDAGWAGGLVSTALLQFDRAMLMLSLSYHKIYACRQHYERYWKHKNGEMSHYLSDPLFTRGRLYMAYIAQKMGWKSRGI